MHDNDNGIWDIVRLEHTRGVLLTVIKQWGYANSLRVLGRTIRSLGPGHFLKNILSGRLSMIAPYLILSLSEVLDEREMIVSHGHVYTFREIRDRTLRLANGLRALGLKPKDMCAELLYNGNEFFELVMAGSLIGCPVPFLNWHLNGNELAQAINRAAPRVFVFDTAFLDTVNAIRDKLTSVEHLIVVGKKAPSGMLLYDDLLRRSSNRIPELNFIFALNPYTAGTTGVPKNVNYYDGFSGALSELAERPKVPFAEYIRFLLLQFSFFYWFGGARIKDPITRNIRCLISTPLYHPGSVVGWAPVVLLGATGVCMPHFEPEEFLRLVEKYRINWAFVVPTILERIIHLPEEVKKRYNLGSMHALICAAAPAAPELKRAVNRLFREQGCKQNVFMEYYGSSETSIVSVLLPEDYESEDKRYESVGRIRCGENGIYDEQKGRWCASYQVGKVLSRTVMTLGLRYNGSPEKLDDVFITVDGAPWFDDGLLGYQDEEGFLYLTGRLKEMIISGGVNVFPNEMEAVIKRHPQVADVAVIRYPDDVLGEVPAAIIQLKAGQHARAEELIDFCQKSGLKGYSCPRHIEFTDTLPRHADGKLLKRVLEDKYWQGIEHRG